MINYIKGKLISKTNGITLLENNGIGYSIHCSNVTLSKLPLEGSEIKLFCYLNVKEDGFTLFGFFNEEEKKMFLKLINISGVGPKVGLAILSGIDLGSLAIAIITGDTKAISKIKGIGKKTAERIILELKEKIVPDEFDLINNHSDKIVLDTDTNDAIVALKSLGFGQVEAYNAVKKAKANAKTIEELIALALKSLYT